VWLRSLLWGGTLIPNTGQTQMDMTRFDTARPDLRHLGRRRRTAGALLLLLLTYVGGCTPLNEEGSSISRGDRAFAKGDIEEALAEYKLALRQGASDAMTYARVAHTYVVLKRIDEAREYYRLAVAQDSTLVDQALSDFVHLAREEDRGGDRNGMASAVETAVEFRPGVNLVKKLGELTQQVPLF